MKNHLKESVRDILTAELAKTGKTVDGVIFNQAWTRFCALAFKLDGSPEAYAAQLGSRLPEVIQDAYKMSSSQVR